MNQLKFQKSAIALVAVALVISAFGSDAAGIDGSYFKERLNVNGTTLKLSGTGLLRHWGLKTYAGALYLEEGSCKFQVITLLNPTVTYANIYA